MSSAVFSLSGVIDELLASDPATLPDHQVRDAVLALRVERDRLCAVIARLDGEFEQRKLHASDPDTAEAPAQSAAAWLAHRRREPLRVTRAEMRFARKLRLLPATSAALEDGTTTAWHAGQLTRQCANRKRAAQMAIDEELLLGQAEQLGGEEFATAVRYWEDLHFADEAEDAAQRRLARRRSSCSRSLDGEVYFDGRLDPIAGTEVKTEWDRIERELFEADWARAKQRHGEDVSVEHLERTAAQRRADALVVMARRSAAAGPGAGTRRPLVTVLIDWPTLLGRICELEDGTSVTPGSVLDLLSCADIERAVWGGDDRIAVSTKSRLFSGAERRAVELRDRFCTAAGCDAPPERCHIDHVVPYSAGGLTEQTNGRLRCRGDHAEASTAPLDRPLPWEYSVSAAAGHQAENPP